MTETALAQCTITDCPHWPHWGHCTKPGCTNYQNDCPVHGAASA